MPENILRTPSTPWPPIRNGDRVRAIGALQNSTNFPLDNTQRVPPIPSTPRTSSAYQQSPLLSAAAIKIYRNGFESTPKIPLYEPYTMARGAHRNAQLFAEPETAKLEPMPELLVGEWNALASKCGLLPEGAVLHEFQMQTANLVLGRSQDLILIAPTGRGKSVVFSLALLAQGRGILVVCTPYTSLGLQGANK